jgi:DNA-binding transcriptional regulator YiaG
MPHRDRAWKLRRGYVYLKGNPMEDPFRSQRPEKGRRVSPADRIEFHPVDVAEIREQFDLPQTEFARLLGISVETLRGRRNPVGPSRALLRIAATHPDLVAHVLGQARADWSQEEQDAWEPLDVVMTRHRARVASRRARKAEFEALMASIEAGADQTAVDEPGPELMGSKRAEPTPATKPVASPDRPRRLHKGPRRTRK